VPSISFEEDLFPIIKEKLHTDLKDSFPKLIIEFVNFLKNLRTKRSISVRDIVSWVEFMNLSYSKLKINRWESYIHGAEVVFLDGIGVGTDSNEKSRLSIKNKLLNFLIKQINNEEEEERLLKIFDYDKFNEKLLEGEKELYGIKPFYIEKGKMFHEKLKEYSMSSKTTSINLYKILRCLQIKKPILLEGSPGVGKTSLILALAKATGHNVVRINLSEQTDIMDLLGTDLPGKNLLNLS
jgi:midasin